MNDDTISRAAAVKALEETKQSDPFNRYEYQNIGIDWSIDAIKALPSAQHVAKDINVPVKDCISRAAALTALERDEEYDKDIPNRADGVRDAIITISALPSARPDVPDTNVGDMISRQAAIEAMRKAKDKSELHRMLVQLPSAQPGWIPVTERLPEYGTTVLTCDHDGEYEINHIIDEEDGEWFLNGAVAWMPIPAPLEGDANG